MSGRVRSLVEALPTPDGVHILELQLGVLHDPALDVHGCHVQAELGDVAHVQAHCNVGVAGLQDGLDVLAHLPQLRALQPGLHQPRCCLAPIPRQFHLHQG